MKICLECAEGGHLDEMLGLIEAFSEHELFFVTTFAESTKNLKKSYNTYYVRKQYNVNKISMILLIELVYMIKLFFLCSYILIKERPNVVVSTGGGSTIPLFYLGKLLGCKLIYVESIARVDNPSGTGRIVYPITDLFLVQWEQMLIHYSKAKYWGSVI